MTEVNLELKKDNKLSDRHSITYSVTKTVGNKTCTIFINDTTKNGFDKNDRIMYKGDISLFAQKEIKDVITNGINNKPYDANNIPKKKSSAGVEKLNDCKEIKEGHYYGLGDVLDCGTKALEAEAKADKITTLEKAAEALKEAKPAASQTATPTAQPAQKPAQPAQQIKAAVPARQVYSNQYYMPAPPQPMYDAPVMYAASPASVVGSSMLAGGLMGGIFGGIFGGLFGGARGFSGGLMSGMMGGMMGGLLGGLGSFGGGFGGFGGGIGGFGCGFGGGFEGGFGAPDATDMALNQIFSSFMGSLSAQSYMMSAYSPANMTGGESMPYSYSPQPLNQRPATTFITTPTQAKAQTQTSTQTNAAAAVSQPQNNTAVPTTTTSANPPQQTSTTSVGVATANAGQPASGTAVTADLVLLPINPPLPEATPVDTSNRPKIDLEPVPDAPVFAYSAQDVKAKIAELKALKANYIKTNPDDKEEIEIFDQQLEQYYRLLDQKMGR